MIIVEDVNVVDIIVGCLTSQSTVIVMPGW